MQPGADNTLIVFSLHDETPEMYETACALLARYGFNRSSWKDEYREIDLPDHTLLGARIDHVDHLRDQLLREFRAEKLQPKALLVARVGDWALQGPCFW